MMTQEEMNGLKPGDTVRSDLNGDTYIVVQQIGIGRHVAVRAVEIESPNQWTMVAKSNFCPSDT